MAEFVMSLPDDETDIVGYVDDKGILTFAIGAQPHSPIRGTEMFNLMMRGLGSRVQAILGVWRVGLGGSPSVNIDRVNERTTAGEALEEAVKQTWTFARASRWGFSKIARIDIVGTSGNYRKIDVLLEKESRGA